jgi:hypothetical protein
MVGEKLVDIAIKAAFVGLQVSIFDNVVGHDLHDRRLLGMVYVKHADADAGAFRAGAAGGRLSLKGFLRARRGAWGFISRISRSAENSGMRSAAR